jgi:XTP/dITP diphosphohydrolase
MILATNNKGKLQEVRKILNEYKIYSLNDKDIHIDVEEDQETFYGNAKKKALKIYDLSKEETIADDSGLCVNALNGFPGVMTHRFLGEDATDQERNQYIIDEVNKLDDRSAKVVCVLVYYNGHDIISTEGVIEGSISKFRKGTNGFGFDEIFELPDGRTLAELSPEDKNELSARAIAAKELKLKLEKIK